MPEVDFDWKLKTESKLVGQKISGKFGSSIRKCSNSELFMEGIQLSKTSDLLKRKLPSTTIFEWKHMSQNFEHTEGHLAVCAAYAPYQQDENVAKM